jgi:Domain of unknown function (DUF3387)
LRHGQSKPCRVKGAEVDIVLELVRAVRADVSTGWTVRENVRAHLRVLVKRTEVLSHGWAAA